MQIVESTSGTVNSTKQFVWCKNQRCEARDGTGNVTARYFLNGQTVGGNTYYYSKDHLGSIREMNGTGGLQAQLNFDAYGIWTQVSGPGPLPDFGYAGMYVHVPSSLNLTPNRAYRPSAGRWLSRDPIQDKTFRLLAESPAPREPRAGLVNYVDPMLLRQLLPPRPLSLPIELNLYAYVANSPIEWTDPKGLAIQFPKWPPPKCPVEGAPGGTDNKKDCEQWCYETFTGADQGKELSDCLARCKEFFLSGG